MPGFNASKFSSTAEAAVAVNIIAIARVSGQNLF
jgi:hypothetical protein